MPSGCNALPIKENLASLYKALRDLASGWASVGALGLSKPWRPFVPAEHGLSVAELQQKLLGAMADAQRQWDALRPRHSSLSSTIAAGRQADAIATDDKQQRQLLRWGRPALRCNVSSVLERFAPDLGASGSQFPQHWRGGGLGQAEQYFERRALMECGAGSWAFERGELLTVVVFTQPRVAECATATVVATSESAGARRWLGCDELKRRRQKNGRSTVEAQPESGLPMHAIFRGVAAAQDDGVSDGDVSSHYMFGSDDPELNRWEMDLWQNVHWKTVADEAGGGPNGIRPEIWL